MTPPEKESGFTRAVIHAETCLSDYYELNPPSQALPFLVDREEFFQLTNRKPSSRAEVCLLRDTDHEDDDEGYFLGIYFSEQIRQTLTRKPPFESLTRENLDAFCVLVEELSHFHLILQRSVFQRQVSRLELEWQAEIDKVLVCALLLKEQAGSWNLDPLTHILFEEARLVNQSHYHEAHRQAAGFWRNVRAMGVGETLSLRGNVFRQFMKSNYHRPLQEKAPFSPGASYWQVKKK